MDADHPGPMHSELFMGYRDAVALETGHARQPHPAPASVFAKVAYHRAVDRAARRTSSITRSQEVT